ncbi:hypothetical protein NPIL_556951 [Nephila pilipes]|uniref:Uncharacterized protein n=1 Tax=Nephila pilipes TaxID=299642 RepID=A0A8X6PC14_NEPPI|nr:hypothetical protein NPIL_556951 [Nephila pilipes]
MTPSSTLTSSTFHVHSFSLTPSRAGATPKLRCTCRGRGAMSSTGSGATIEFPRPLHKYSEARAFFSLLSAALNRFRVLPECLLPPREKVLLIGHSAPSFLIGMGKTRAKLRAISHRSV